MERIAVISDIHGNMSALRAVLADIDARGITRIFNLGDNAGKGPDGDQVIDICRERFEVNVRGNWDELLAIAVDADWATPIQEQIGRERCAWLGALPFAHDLLFGGKRIRLVHASPQGTSHRVYQVGPDEEKLAMFETTEHTDPDFVPDVVGYADIHTAYVRSFRQRVLFNVGSVGNPLDQTMACYVVLEASGDSLGINIVRVPYDIEEALRDARASGMPGYAEYEWELTTARSRHNMPRDVAVESA